MKFIFLFGQAAVGKLTVAEELRKKTGFRLFDNHLVVDAVLALYDFGTPQFIALREALWRTAFAEVAKDKSLPGLIFTFNPENSVAQQFIDDLFTLFEEAGADVRCIELTCPEALIEQRLSNASRHQKRKLVDLELYRKLRAAGVFNSPVIERNRLVIDTSKQSPVEAAAEIAASLDPNPSSA